MVLSVAKKLKGKEDYLKETSEIRKENFQTVKRLGSQGGVYGYLVYVCIVTKGKFPKQQSRYSHDASFVLFL